MKVRENHIWVPRRLIYGQAALLGLSAATFFLLGLMVGNLTSPGNSSTTNSSGFEESTFVEDCRVSGVVTVSDRGKELPDVGAVVLLFPRHANPEKRQAPGLVMPNTFIELDNPTIDAVHNAGGAVVRADADGAFEVLVDQGREYRLLVISKSRSVIRNVLTEPQSKMLSTWFAPAEKIVRDNDFQWRDVIGNSDRIEVGTIEF